jgi:hypothetical protein
MSKQKVQVKFTIDSQIAAAFKAHCVAQNVSMASVISKFMDAHCPTRNTNFRIETRPQRRKTIAQIILLLEEILSMEELYRDSIPEQFETRYETASQACEQLDQAVSCLEEAY